MTKENKELLLKDLCARLPYGVIVKMGEYSDYKVVGINLADEHPIKLLITSRDDNTIVSVYAKLFKPYLRPMSSMTEEEKKDLLHLTIWDENDLNDIIKYPHMYEFTISIKAFDWLNKNHFDYRDLIQRGLAIEVTKDNNPYK